MKIKSSSLLEKLKQLTTAVPANGKMPILENVLIKDGKISATDLRLAIISGISIKEHILLPFRPLQNILNEVGDCEIEIIQGETEIRLISGDDVFSLGKPNDTEQYPFLSEIDNDSEFAIGELFFEAMKNASKHESPNEQLTIHGINISVKDGNIEIAGTDTTTIYVARFPAGESMEFSAHIDSSFCKAVEGWSTAKISFSERFVSCRNEASNVEVRIQMLETKYPNYGIYMPQEVEINCVVSKKELDASIRKCIVFGGDIKTIKLTFEEKNIVLEYSNAESYQKAVTRVGYVGTVPVGYCMGISAELIQRTLYSIGDTESICFCIPEEPGKPVYVQNENVLILIVPSIIQ